MKRKAKISSVFIIIMLILCLVFSGCKKNFTYPFLCDVSQIKEIKIGVRNQGIFQCDDICKNFEIKVEIEDKEEFIKDFSELKFNYNPPGDPVPLPVDTIAIIFIYSNGYSEAVGCWLQSKVKDGEEYYGIVHTDEASFNNLLLKWYPDFQNELKQEHN